METLVTMTVNGAALTCSRQPTLLQTLEEASVPIATACGGAGSCHLCRVEVLVGREHLPSPAAKEVRALGNVRIAQGMRLACQIPPHPGLSLVVPPPRRRRPLP